MISIHHFKLTVPVLIRRTASAFALAIICLLISASSIASAATANTSTSGSTSSSTTSTSTSSSTEEQHLQNIITKGNEEIDRRLGTLNTLTSKITSAHRLTASDQSALTSEVASTISGLTTLKTQLDGDTTLSAAKSDAQSIYTEYRVYALVAPKIFLIKVADDQQYIQSKLSNLAQKIQARLTDEQKAGKNVASLQSQLSDMTARLAAAEAISSKIENEVIDLQPTDYNNDHSILSGDNIQLQNAHSDEISAFQDAKNIISALKSL